MFEFEGKNIIIFGASSGIGEKTARILAEQGAYVILVARRDNELNRICAEIGNERACYYVNDISNIESIEGLIDRIVKENGKLDGMVYTAGVSLDLPIKNITYDRIKSVFDINFFGFIECVRQITLRSNYNKGLRIVAVSSTASILGELAHTMYSASKAAMDGAVRCLAKELSRKGIAINTVQPSMIDTYMYRSFLDNVGEGSSIDNKLKERQYLGIGETEDVANAISFLLSSKARFITGTALLVDGGYATT